MDQKSLLTQALEFIQAQRRHRRWLRTVTGMAAVVVFVTTYLLILPAITMENSILEVNAVSSRAALGERIETEIYASADDGRKETFFVLAADGRNAGLDESRFDFKRDVAVVESEDGQDIELHREYTEDGVARYWFVLEQGQTASFSLSWVNGVDRWRTETEEISVPERPEPGGASEEPETPEEPVPEETPETPEEPVPDETTEETPEKPVPDETPEESIPEESIPEETPEEAPEDPEPAEPEPEQPEEPSEPEPEQPENPEPSEPEPEPEQPENPEPSEPEPEQPENPEPSEPEEEQPEPEYICGLEEHLHDPETCYDAEGQLICTLEEHQHTEACLELCYEDGRISVTATPEYEDAIPADAQFQVTPVDADTEGYRYDAYLQALEEAWGGDGAQRSVLLYDIAFLVEETVDGGEPQMVEFQPTEGAVRIQFTFQEPQVMALSEDGDETLQVLHLPPCRRGAGAGSHHCGGHGNYRRGRLGGERGGRRLRRDGEVLPGQLLPGGLCDPGRQRRVYPAHRRNATRP